MATLRREGQAQFTCAAKPRSERAFTKPGLAGFVISLSLPLMQREALWFKREEEITWMEQGFVRRAAASYLFSCFVCRSARVEGALVRPPDTPTHLGLCPKTQFRLRPALR